MSEVKHTPLPWRIGAACNGNWIEAGEPGNVISVGRTFHDHVGGHVEDANARLIVQAVNSHGDLVEALRLARKRLNGIFECSEDRYSATAAETAIDEIDTALSKVLELGEGL